MKINGIKICNISSFVGVQEFDFTVTDKKSVVLIGGLNGTGKTSLFTAIKLALYGPLCFNYQYNSNIYLSKVKELINHDAFASSEVNAYIEVNLDIPNEREIISYVIKRVWNYDAQKLNEELIVLKAGNILAEDDMIFFQNYLFTILPPNLFDFFFFDGEQIADFFAANNYNTHIKNALLTLCSFDTFELIRKFCDNYVNGGYGTEEVDEVATKYQKITDEIGNVIKNIATLEEEIINKNANITKIQYKKEELENQFKNSGGLREKEISELNKQLKDLERIKNECNLRIKSFVESSMPFIIAKNIVPSITKQLKLEDEMQKYQALVNKLNSQEVFGAIHSTISALSISDINREDFISKLTIAITSSAMPNVDVDNFVYLHDLSKEQQSKVAAVLETIKKFNSNKFIKNIIAKDKASSESMLISKKLRDSMADIDAHEYSLKFSSLTKDEFESKKILESMLQNLEMKKENLVRLQNEKAQLFEQLKSKTKDKNVYELTQRTSMLMNKMVQELTVSKFKEIEINMLSILKKIMRKENFIDLVELDSNFNIYLYKEQTYAHKDLTNLIKNIGHDELAKRIGNTGVQKLLEFFSIDSIAKLKNSLKRTGDQIALFEETPIELYKKIEFNQLSKGEKQVFVLSLYWAIIKVSGNDIPFIIDTPYARIDTEHREQISKEFFPTVSKQVIILSTDEEITEHYYSVMKPFIVKEYLLEYDEANSKTTVSNKYFFKG
ncbi:DNA sulfur modification protein DndD [Ruminiclostridium papyrosolvens DSM 2782]|uniref:Nuclease SbcCD subunit C n=1 Tax=Ruminiclostridium papyrosolvens DSM 2782 TaxID=588581 RepID=F1TIK3_9FIRM|nr:AAA family ATPase [Ruminiclostridium papyrosolvens]EGD45820.1 DNA sulfur modification protein DndD [Ruminiclostridium papyrosolvens DSM 2782]WES33860.1 AAA family ATPase [Ruminiclostridium papyrosolvens DSM 2782]